MMSRRSQYVSDFERARCSWPLLPPVVSYCESRFMSMSFVDDPLNQSRAFVNMRAVNDTLRSNCGRTFMLLSVMTAQSYLRTTTTHSIWTNCGHARTSRQVSCLCCRVVCVSQSVSTNQPMVARPLTTYRHDQGSATNDQNVLALSSLVVRAANCRKSRVERGVNERIVTTCVCPIAQRATTIDSSRELNCGRNQRESCVSCC